MTESKKNKLFDTDNSGRLDYDDVNYLVRSSKNRRVSPMTAPFSSRIFSVSESCVHRAAEQSVQWMVGILQHFQAFLVTEPVEILVTEPVEVLASSFLCSREESTPAQRQ